MLNLGTRLGQDYVHDYDDVNFDAVNIIREIRDKSLCVSGFDLCNLNIIVHRSALCVMYCSRLLY